MSDQFPTAQSDDEQGGLANPAWDAVLARLDGLGSRLAKRANDRARATAGQTADEAVARRLGRECDCDPDCNNK